MYQVLTMMARGPEFRFSAPQKTPGEAACTCHPAQTGEVWEFTILAT